MVLATSSDTVVVLWNVYIEPYSCTDVVLILIHKEHIAWHCECHLISRASCVRLLHILLILKYTYRDNGVCPPPSIYSVVMVTTI